MKHRRSCGLIVALAVALTAAACTNTIEGPRRAEGSTTPIGHVVVIYDENVSFDHYFATYPRAENPSGQPTFDARADTPAVNGLDATLLTANPNGANPHRLDRSEALTCDQDHEYAAEQKAYNHGLVDAFVENTGGQCADRSTVMGFFDGNTVTAMWNYAQQFAMSDNFFASTFGQSTAGAINLVSGQTHGAVPVDLPGYVANGTLIQDADPTHDACSKSPTVGFSGRNVGNLLNERGVTWGWFEGGFRPTSAPGQPIVCGSSHPNIGGHMVTDYIPHHEPFQYYTSTANPQHLAPSSPAMVGKNDAANHQYDLEDFWSAPELPAVSFLKAPGYQDGHAGYSDPLDEQRFLVETINRLQERPEWDDMAIIVSYDDSDGWYDHVLGPIVNPSNDPANDFLSAPGECGMPEPGAYLDRCGYGPRLPLLVISPFSRQNYVDHQVLDQTSILRFIEDNWELGRIGDQSFDAKASSMATMFDVDQTKRTPPLILDPSTGARPG
ncbi:MAG TPA: alkaline phosphatase family protein [Acidimicrobiales bacterium]|nr:alkaline phosphatase family protein [Acidimicrobiales bacterium]